MYHITTGEFHITNVCNINCHNCNRYNNFAFSGHYLWKDYADYYRAWSKIITFNRVGILGGEPMSNPDLLSWVHGLAELWPDVSTNIVTNGTYLSQWTTLHSELSRYKGQVWIEVAGHNWRKVQDQLQEISDWFPDGCEKKMLFDNDTWRRRYAATRRDSWPDCDTVEEFFQMPLEFQHMCYEHCQHPTQIFMTEFVDAKGVLVLFTPMIYFQDSALRYQKDSSYVTLRNSDPQKAVDVCYSKTCHTFFKGKLYKCPTAALLPEFLGQFDIGASAQDIELLKSYEPAEHTWSKDRLDAFIKNLNDKDPIAQCRFCPETDEVGLPLESGPKKIKLIKIRSTA